MWCVVLCYDTLCYFMLCCVMFRYTVWYYVVLCCIVSCCVALYCVVWWDILLYFVLLYCILLPYSNESNSIHPFNIDIEEEVISVPPTKSPIPPENQVIVEQSTNNSLTSEYSKRKKLCERKQQHQSYERRIYNNSRSRSFQLETVYKGTTQENQSYDHGNASSGRWFSKTSLENSK